VSKPPSVTRITAMPAGLAASCAAVRIALPKAPAGKFVSKRRP